MHPFRRCGGVFCNEHAPAVEILPDCTPDELILVRTVGVVGRFICSAFDELMKIRIVCDILAATEASKGRADRAEIGI